jgi:hypothetical protein
MPTFNLPPCPVCSTISSIERPFWKNARHTAKRTGVNAYQLIGCSHAMQVLKDQWKLYSDADEIELVEGAWQHLAEQLFDDKVRTWPVLSIEKFRRELNGDHFLPGVTAALPLQFDEPPHV